MRHRAPREAGQASLEVLALLPVLVGVALAGVYVMGLLASAGRSQDRARHAALRAAGDSGAIVTVTGASRVPSLLPGAPTPMPWRVSAAVRVP